MIFALESTRLFSGATAEELQLWTNAVQMKTFSPGQIIFAEGDEGNGLYLVKDGMVQVSAVVSQDERRILSRVGPGEFFGEMAVIDREPRSATVTAEQETVVYFIPRDEMLRMLESCPRLAVDLMREFSLRLREFNRQYMQEVLQAERLALVGRFTRSIVHDFKNPLNIIGLAADLAGIENATLPMRQMARDRIRKQVERLSSMINELLDFTRAPQSPVVLAETDFAAYVRHILDDLRQDSAEAAVIIECANDPPALTLLCDPARLIHVFSNLIHNAIEAMPNGGRVVLRFTVTDSEVITEIEDTGPGIPLEVLPRLFEAFVTHGKTQGTGLGLSICRRIIEDHGGAISARNEPGRGAVFTFTLPRPQ